MKLSLYTFGVLSLVRVIPCFNGNDPLIVPLTKFIDKEGSRWPVVFSYIAVRQKVTMGLRQDIRSLISGISEKSGFVSLESLEECMTEQKVKEHVSSIDIPISPGGLEAIFSRPRLFAILVLLGCEKAMVPLIADIEDDTFFYFTEEDVPSKIGDSEQRAEFYKLQSHIAPKLSCKNPPQEFPGSFRPPFNKSKKGPSGSYGIVHKVNVAGGHLAEYSSVSCQYIKFPREN